MTVAVSGGLDDTIAGIYDAALDFAKWPAVLERIADHLGASVACLVKHDLATLQGDMLMVRTDPVYARLYRDHYARINVFAERARNQPPQTCVTDRMFLPKEELFRTEFYDGFMRPQNVHTLLNVYLLADKECGTRIAFARAPRLGEWEQSHIDALLYLAPHLHRAALINRQLEPSGQVLSLTCLNALPQAVFLVDADCRVRFTNSAADRLIAEGDGLAVKDRCLVAGEATSQLRRMASAAASPPAAMTERSSLTAARLSGRGSYRLLVAPIPAARTWFSLPQPSVMVIAYDPTTVLDAAIVSLAREHGLTRAEAATVRAISRGMGLASAAAASGVSPTTARTHLQRVFAKTGTRRQSELVRLVAERSAVPG